jgi:8-amino-7-oxononanoate synthase
MRSLDEFAGEKLGALERVQLRRSPVVTARAGIWAERDGRRLLSFSCNDYLNLSQHPEVIAAAIDAVARYGVGAGASRLVTGNHPLYGELENRLARLKGTEAACVFGSGYLANTGIIPAASTPAPSSVEPPCSFIATPTPTMPRRFWRRSGPAKSMR